MKTNDCLQIVVMGISSTGKTVVARRLAEEFGLRFAEGDDFHSQRSVDKMAAGIPLTDEDRWPWLETLADLIARSHASHESSVLTCSALRRGYRDILRSKAPGPLGVLHPSGRGLRPDSRPHDPSACALHAAVAAAVADRYAGAA